jgi:plastocyanin
MRPILLVLLLAAPALAGCASDDGAGTPPTAPTTTATPTPQAAAPLTLDVSTSGAYPVNPGFSPATLEAPAGATVTVKLRNAETAPLISHDWVLEGVDGAAVKSLSPGQSGEATFTAPAAGEYKYFCSIGDHRQRGMEGTLTVK